MCRSYTFACWSPCTGPSICTAARTPTPWHSRGRLLEPHTHCPVHLGPSICRFIMSIKAVCICSCIAICCACASRCTFMLFICSSCKRSALASFFSHPCFGVRDSAISSNLDNGFLNMTMFDSWKDLNSSWSVLLLLIFCTSSSTILPFFGNYFRHNNPLAPFASLYPPCRQTFYYFGEGMCI